MRPCNWPAEPPPAWGSQKQQLSPVPAPQLHWVKGREECLQGAVSPPHLGGVGGALRLSCDCSLLCDLCQGPVNPVPSLDLTAVTFTLETVQLHPIPRTGAQRFSTCPGAKAPSCGHPAPPCPALPCPAHGPLTELLKLEAERGVGGKSARPSPLRPSVHLHTARVRGCAQERSSRRLLKLTQLFGGPGGLPTLGLACDIWWCVCLRVCWLHVS